MLESLYKTTATTQCTSQNKINVLEYTRVIKRLASSERALFPLYYCGLSLTVNRNCNVTHKEKLAFTSQLKMKYIKFPPPHRKQTLTIIACKYKRPASIESQINALICSVSLSRSPPIALSKVHFYVIYTHEPLELKPPYHGIYTNMSYEPC